MAINCEAPARAVRYPGACLSVCYVQAQCSLVWFGQTTWGLIYESKLSLEKHDTLQRERYDAIRAKYHCDAFLHIDEVL